MKAHLYKQVLTSLRLLYADRNIELQLNEQIDFGRILYNKGLYMQSLKTLDKAKQVADPSRKPSDGSQLPVCAFKQNMWPRRLEGEDRSQPQPLGDGSLTGITICHA